MAPVANTMATLSHIEGVSDGARARELYKYYQPTDPVNSDACFITPSSVSMTGSPSDALQSNKEIGVFSNVSAGKVSSPDTALTAFCQLTTWRVGAQRAMISVIDAETQYFLAESTKSLDLQDNTKHDAGDEIWMGCSSVTKAGRLCERTLAVSPVEKGQYPSFVVDDLSTDERFSQLPFVTGPPYLRFYAGVPLVTKRGIPIGSLFVVDDRVGMNGLDKEKIQFMGTVADTIMKHMEMVREVEEHRRGMKMSRGLASFVEGRAELVEAEADAEDTEGTKIAGHFETDYSIARMKSRSSMRGSTVGDDGVTIGSTAGTERKEMEYSAALAQTEAAILDGQRIIASPSPIPSARLDQESTSQPGSFAGTSMSVSSPQETADHSASSPGEDTSEASSMRLLFSRAANLIREAFEVDGGAVFYDAQIGFSSNAGRQPEPVGSMQQEDSYNDLPLDSHASDNDFHSFNEQASDRDEAVIPPPAFPPHDSSPGLSDDRFSRTTSDIKKRVEVLGFSTANAASINSDPMPGHDSFIPFGEKALHTLLRRYPRGKLWTFDPDGAVSSSSDDELKPLARDPEQRQKDLRRRKLRSTKAKSDARFLSKHFPGVRQLLFVPLWDAGRSRWLSGGFAWSTEPTRVLSKQGELAFLTAFGNSVMAEWSRIDTEIADQKKGDFIGSISHELRSPLHGILASAEFLEEMTTGWQKGLVETIDSCGRTLLDTINHILDYSKINHFEKNWRKTKRGIRPLHSSTEAGPLALRKSDLPMLNLFQEVDISVLCEEVVESVFAGHVFQNVTTQSFDTVPDVRGKMSDAKKLVTTSDQMLGPHQASHGGVSVILDIDLQNYHFITQPGALRRLIMNLLGNALKYTSHGYVKIKLEATDMEDFRGSLNSAGSTESIPRSMVALTVTDTGKGISPEFLRSKLFMPFAQENSLSNGTGLGLSIVRKIVSLLEGEITIDSEIGRGTQVRVTLPLLREMPRTADSTNSTSTQKSLTALARDSDEAVTSLRSRVLGKKVALHGFDMDTRDPIVREMGLVLKASVTTFLVKWYGLSIVPLGQKADIIICNEASLPVISQLANQSAGAYKNNPSIVVLRSHNTRFDRSLSLAGPQCNIGYVAKPVGPLKLAKAILQCIVGASLATPIEGPSMLSPPESSDLSNVFEELALSPHGGEVLDNTRMAADSDNARKAIESPTPNAIAEKHAEFPFPALIDDKPSLQTSKTMPEDKERLSSLATLENPRASLLLASAQKQKGSPRISADGLPKPKIASPTLLLVDDNQINIRLLSTYLNRRNYEVVHEAQNGLEAVQKVEKRMAGEAGVPGKGYDIIFMDITMPVLDGFGATRQIRAIEEKHQASLLSADVQSTLTAGAGSRGRPYIWSKVGSENNPPALVDERSANTGLKFTPSLIIAFTGRSSIDDQNEAVRVGIDLFMTKPVAFKEVGKIIDNWVANRGREDRGPDS